MSRSSLGVVACVAGLALVARAQFFNFNIGGGMPPPAEVKGQVRLEPAHAVVGIPCSFVFTFEGTEKVRPTGVTGLPDSGVAYLAETLEPYADNTYRLPVRFLAPCTNTLHLKVEGTQTVERRSGNVFRSASSSFRKELPPLKLEVRALPEEGRPASFSGAVGTSFTMTQTLTPDHVHPGDLVTATYTLAFDGYCPSNAWPRIEHLSKEFKTYDPKEVAATPTSRTWTQVLVPRTVSATNSPLVSLSYYNPRTRRYEVARAYPKKLVFVSDRAASTQNTAVMVNAADASEPGSQAAASGTSAVPSLLVLRFGPSDASPVIATLPRNTPVKERARSNGWRRLETPRATGWSR